MKKTLICSILVLSACTYLPLVDYFVPADFEKYASSPELHTLSMCEESIKLSFQTFVWLPKNSRGKSLNECWIDLILSIEQEEYSQSEIDIFLEHLSILLVQSNGNKLEEQINRRMYILRDTSFKAQQTGTVKAHGQGLFEVSNRRSGDSLTIRAYFYLDRRIDAEIGKIGLTLEEDFASLSGEKCGITPISIDFKLPP